MGRPLSVEKYEAAWRAYQEVQSVKYVADKVGIHYNTARKYVEEGDPDRGLLPLAERFRQLMEDVRSKLDRPVAELRAEKIRMLDVVFDKTFRNLMTRQEGYLETLSFAEDDKCPECGRPTGTELTKVKPHLATPKDLATVGKTLDDMLGGKDTALEEKVENLSRMLMQLWHLAMVPKVARYLETLRELLGMVDVLDMEPDEVPDVVLLVNSAASEVGDKLLSIAGGDQS